MWWQRFVLEGGGCSLNGFLHKLKKFHVQFSFAYLVFVLLWPEVDKVYFDYPPIYCASFVSVWYIHPSLRTEPLNDFVDQWIFERFQLWVCLFHLLGQCPMYTYINNDLRPSIDTYHQPNKYKFCINNKYWNGEILTKQL